MTPPPPTNYVRLLYSPNLDSCTTSLRLKQKTFDNGTKAMPCTKCLYLYTISERRMYVSKYNCTVFYVCGLQRPDAHSLNKNNKNKM